MQNIKEFKSILMSREIVSVFNSTNQVGNQVLSFNFIYLSRQI
jgi:hypothetical protein